MQDWLVKLILVRQQVSLKYLTHQDKFFLLYEEFSRVYLKAPAWKLDQLYRLIQSEDTQSV